ncbi:MAG: hypothetical protein ABIE70_04020 [bacterium]
MREKRLTMVVVAAALAILLSASLFADDISKLKDPQPLGEAPNQELSSPKGTYTGTLRMYVVKPTYHWNDNSGQPYEFGFMNFSEVTTLNIPEGGSYYHEANIGVAGMLESNAAVIGALFDPTPHSQNGCPGQGSCPFWAYYGDGCALAYCGEAATQPTADGYTHAVFVEEGTTTW